MSNHIHVLFKSLKGNKKAFQIDQSVYHEVLQQQRRNGGNIDLLRFMYIRVRLHVKNTMAYSLQHLLFNLNKYFGFTPGTEL